MPLTWAPSPQHPSPDLCTPLPSTRHTEVVYRDRGSSRDIYLRRCSMGPCNQLVNRARPSHPCPPTSPTGQSCPSSCCLFSLPARSPKRPVPRHLPPLRIPPRPGPVPPRPPARQLASLPLRPPSGLAPAHRPGCPGRAETPPPAANAPGPVGRRLCTVGGYLGTGRDREAGPPGSPCQGPLPPVPPCPTHPSNAPHPHHRPASIWARTVGPGSPLHRLTDHIWVIKRHATLSGARKCWWGTYLYGGGPCTAFLHTK